MAIRTKAALLTAALLVMCAAGSADAQSFRGRLGVRRGYIYTPFFYDPFWGPYPYPYGAYTFGVPPEADVKVEVTPKQAEVYVDGFYAGVADDFDGVFKRLHTTPGGHAITLHLEGYRTITQNLYASPGSTYKLRDTMERLAAGETSVAPPSPSRPGVRPRASVAPRQTAP
jgi:hypothetical protein